MFINVAGGLLCFGVGWDPGSDWVSGDGDGDDSEGGLDDDESDNVGIGFQ